jgi:hypothetical protein
MSLSQSLANYKARKQAQTRSNRSGLTLHEALAGRSNGGSMTLREALASRSNPKSRRNPVSRAKLRDTLQTRAKSYQDAREKFAKDPSVMNRKLVERQKRILESLKDDIKATEARISGGRKAPKKASKKAPKKASTRKTTVAGKPQEAAAYKALSSTAKKSKFTRAYNTAFKKAKRSGKNVSAAHSSAVAAGKRAISPKKSAKRSTRKNPASNATANLARIVEASRSNPKKKSARKSTKKTASRKPRTTSAISKHATQSKLYKKLKTAAQKKKFVTEFNKAFRSQNAKRGVTEAQAAARAALGAYSKTVSGSKTVTKKSTRKPAKRTTAKRTTAKRSSSKRATSLEAAAKSSKLYRKLSSAAKKTAFVKAFKSAHSKIARKASSAAQANARAALSAYSKVTKGGTRKNPALENPRKKTSSKRSSKRSSSSSRARAKRLKGGMRKSAMQVLSKYGAYVYRVVIGGKVIELKANKNSSVYKTAKSKGLGAVKLSKLRGKKNTPTSLNLRSVYKVVDGRPSKKDFQRAINAWAGALDGGKIRGVSKKDIARTRMNPMQLRKHTVNALANPAPMSMSMQNRIMSRRNVGERSGMDMAKLGGIGAISFASTLYLSNYASSLLGASFLLNVTDADVQEKNFRYIAREALPTLAASAVAGFGLYKKFVKKADISDQSVALYGGMLAGSLTSLISRTLVKKMGEKIPGFARVASAGGDAQTFGTYLVDNQSHNLEGVDMSRLYGTHNVGRYVQVPAVSGVGRGHSDLGRYVQTPAMSGIGRGSSSMGEYIPYPVENQLGAYQFSESGRMINDDVMAPQAAQTVRSNPIHPGRISPIGGNTQTVPNRAPLTPAGTFNINLTDLQEDLELQQPLSDEDLNAEGLVEAYANGMQMRILRCTPDIARQVVEANFGSIIGESHVIPGSILVLANMFDTPQATTLTDRLRLNRAPEVPKGASFPTPGGVFSRVAFSSLFPSVNNQASFQEFGVKI